MLNYLLGATGCKLDCRCCGAATGYVQCTKDSIYLQVDFYPNSVQSVIANAQDTFNYYTTKGYTCTQFVGPNPSELLQVCGPLHIQNAENGGNACSSDPGLDCEP